MIKPIKCAQKFNTSFFIISMIILSACSSRKNTSHVSKTSKTSEVMSKIKNRDLHRFVNSWTGVRYRYGGIDKRGIDCSGFAYQLEKEVYGIRLPRKSEEQAENIKRKHLDDLKEGDLVFFAFGGGRIDHVGVYLNNGFFVHASTMRGVIVDDLSLPVYKKAFKKAGSVRN